jgi:hypothetical protein
MLWFTARPSATPVGRSGSALTPNSASRSEHKGASPGDMKQPESSGVSFSRLVFKVLRDGFRNQQDMVKFVQSMLVEEDAQRLLLELDQVDKQSNLKPWIPRLQDILRCDFRANVGFKPHERSFERIIVPFMLTLCRRDVQNNASYMAFKSILTLLALEPDFFSKVCDCVQTLVELGRLPAQRSSGVQITGLAGFLDPACELLLLTVQRVQDAKSDANLQVAVQRLRQANETVQSDVAARHLRDLQVIFDSVARRPEVEHKAKVRSAENASTALAYQLTMGVDIPPEDEPGPGSMHPEGPRHDNDHEDYRKVAIYPSCEEIMCSARPYLPRGADASMHVADPVDRFLDTQFRLLREDSLKMVRDGIQGFIRERALDKMAPDIVRYRTNASTSDPDDPKAVDVVQLTVFRNVELSDFSPRIGGSCRGLCFTVKFDQWKQAGRSVQSRSHFWESGVGSRSLDVDSLICIALNVPKRSASSSDRASPRLIFGVVGERRTDDLKKEPKASFVLRLLDNKQLPDLLDYMSAQRLSQSTSGGSSETVALQVRGHFFATYGPTLQTLQEHRIDTVPFLGLLVPAVGGDRFGESVPPRYLKAGLQYDLSFLWKESERPRPPLQIEVKDPRDFFAEVSRALHAVENDIDLDQSQIDAFAAALAQSTPLIQGPPGTVQ